jgi:hypothetical protein
MHRWARRLVLLQTDDIRLFLRQQQQMVNGLRKIAQASVFRLMSPCLHLHVSRSNGKWQLSFVFCKQKMESANFSLLADNGNRKRKFVFLGWQMISSWRQVLLQQPCPSMLLCYCCCSKEIHSLCITNSCGQLYLPREANIFPHCCRKGFSIICHNLLIFPHLLL